MGRVKRLSGTERQYGKVQIERVKRQSRNRTERQETQRQSVQRNERVKREPDL